MQVHYEHLPRQRRLEGDLRNEIQGVVKLGANKKLIQSHLMSKGRICVLKDLHNLNLRTGDELSDAIGVLKRQEGKYIVKIFRLKYCI